MAQIKFHPPKELTSMVQDSHTDGGTFELMATFKQEGEDWCLVSVEDVKLDGYKDKDGEGGKFGDAYKEHMQKGTGSAPMTSTEQY